MQRIDSSAVTIPSRCLPMPMQDFLPPSGQLDIFEYSAADRCLHVAGWLLFPDGPASSLAILPPGASVAGRLAIVPRTDVAEAYPWIPRGDQCGFRHRFEGLTLAPGEVFEFAIELTRDDGTVVRQPIGYREPTGEYPLPDSDFIRRVTGSPSVRYFLATGIRHACDVVRLLQPYRSPDSVRSFLDWGCGSGRVTRHLGKLLPHANVHGSDIDHEAIAWLSGTMPDGRFFVSPKAPPFTGVADASFDLILASSVFTHLSAPLQLSWLEELHRVLVPGGVLMATSHGRCAAAWLHAADVDRALDESGFFDGYGDSALGDIASADYYRSTFQTSEYTRAHWLRHFDELHLAVGGLNFHQDVWILEAR